MTDSLLPFPESLKGRYADARYIGSGGSSRVFAARDGMLNKKVAIKILGPNATEQQLVRFQQEARVISKLSHPHIVRVIDFGVTDGKMVYMVMDLIEGEPLSSLIKTDNCLSLRESIEIFKQVSSAMSYAHEQSILHRDLKPANVLIEKNSNKVNARVADFGLAKYSGTHFQLDTGSVVIGTPAYMSPEQFNGEETSERSDAYSFGCLMYATLSGSPPFQGDTITELAIKHLNEPVPIILQTAEGEDVPGELQEIVYKCLEKRSDYRPASFAQIIESLNSIDLNKAVQRTSRTGALHARPHMTPYLVSPPKPLSTFGSIFSYRIVVVISILVFVALGAICFSLFDISLDPSALLAGRKPAATKGDVVEDAKTWKAPERRSRLADSDLEGTVDTLIERAKISMERKRYDFALQLLNRAVERNEKSHKARKYRSEVFAKLASYDKAIEDLNVGLQLRPDDNKMRFRRAEYYLKADNAKGSLSDLNELVTKQPENFKFIRMRAGVYMVTGQSEKALADYTRAIELNPDDENSNKERGKLYQQKGDHKNAIRDFTVAVNQTQDNANNRYLRGLSYYETGEYGKAVQDASRAIELKEGVASFYELRARSYLKLGKKELAGKDRERAQIDDFPVHFRGRE